MISRAGIILILFGNKKIADGSIEYAKGVKRELEIALSKGLWPIPIHYTGYMASKLYNFLLSECQNHGIPEQFIKEVGELKFYKDDVTKSVSEIISIINKVTN
jgi:hypothetical protein